MPFCNVCAVFEPNLDENGFCSACSMKFLRGEISEHMIKNQITTIENQLDFNSLTYPKKLAKFSPFSTSQNSSSISLLDTLINEDESARINGNNLQSARNIQNHNYRRSSIALSTTMLGFILIFIPGINIIGFVLVTSGMIMAINARRIEGRNWRQLAATGISFIFWIIVIFIIIISMNDSSFLDQFTSV